MYCGVHAEGNELSTRSRLGYVLTVTQAQVFTTSILYACSYVYATPPSRGHMGA